MLRFRFSSGLAVAAALIVAALARAQVPAAVGSANAIPEMARIMGIRVGFDTMERLERILGPGLPYTGGHPRGARQWRSKQTGWYINADGFDYNGVGRVADQVSISRQGFVDDKHTPVVNAPARTLRFMGVVSLDDARSAVLIKLRNRLPAPMVKGDSLVWHAAGHYEVAPFTQWNLWTAELSFRAGRLDTIQMSAQYDRKQTRRKPG